MEKPEESWKFKSKRELFFDIKNCLPLWNIEHMLRRWFIEDSFIHRPEPT
jgi:hypothetical protein